MRSAHALKGLPRFLFLAPAFGALVALLSQQAMPVRAGVVQEFKEQKCSATTCSEIKNQRGNCAEGFYCQFGGDIRFPTCRPATPKDTCINSEYLYSSINCGGVCNDPMRTECKMTVYWCDSKVPPEPLPPPNPNPTSE